MVVVDSVPLKDHLIAVIAGKVEYLEARLRAADLAVTLAALPLEVRLTSHDRRLGSLEVSRATFMGACFAVGCIGGAIVSLLLKAF